MYLLKGAKSLSEETDCFHRAFALWRDGMSDEKHEEIRRLSSALIEKFRRFFSFSSNSVKEHDNSKGRNCRRI